MMAMNMRALLPRLGLGGRLPSLVRCGLAQSRACEPLNSRGLATAPSYLNLESNAERTARLNEYAVGAGPVRTFMLENYRHFNAASTVDAAVGYTKFIDSGGKMFLTLAGAMSSAQLGISVAKMIRAGKVSGISCTGANLEEDIFNLVAHDSYERVPGWRFLSETDEEALHASGRNRVTDTCIPEEEAFRRVGRHLLQVWQQAEADDEKLMPYELFFKLLKSGVLEQYYQIDPKNSWMVAAADAGIPVYCPGWEDSTSANICVSEKLRGNIKGYPVKNGLEQMEDLVSWYIDTQKESDVGFFQIGGGIAGDFPICAVPLIRQDLERPEIKYWKYFCQISEAVTSYGGYSGAPPNEKITYVLAPTKDDFLFSCKKHWLCTVHVFCDVERRSKLTFFCHSWGKMSAGTPQFVVESDATIVFPLIAAFVLNE